jgi:TrmH family RNA methyltransferase
MALSREKAKLIDRLRNPRFRAREGAFLVEGVRSAKEFLLGGNEAKPRFALVSPRLSLTGPGQQFNELLEASGLPVEEVSDGEMGSLSDTEHSQGILMVVAEPPTSLATIQADGESRILLLDGIQDPGNGGTLIRAAWAFGLQGVICLEGSVDPFNPKVVRASAGAMAHIPVLKAPWAEVEGWLRAKGLPLFLADSGGLDVRTFPAPDCWALAVGNEGAGPREALKGAAQETLSILMESGVDSLNAGLAGAILLFSLVGNPGTGMEN